jgi:ribosomal protein S12 methylthiotransferase
VLYEGRAAHQAPEVDGITTVRSAAPLAAGEIVTAMVTGSEGVDLTATVLADIQLPSSR